MKVLFLDKKVSVRPVPAIAQQRARSFTLLHPLVWPGRLPRRVLTPCLCWWGSPWPWPLALAAEGMIYCPHISWAVLMKSHGAVSSARVGEAGCTRSNHKEFLFVCWWELWFAQQSRWNWMLSLIGTVGLGSDDHGVTKIGRRGLKCCFARKSRQLSVLPSQAGCEALPRGKPRSASSA